MKRGRTFKKTLLVAFCCLMGLTVLLTGTAAFLWLRGRAAMDTVEAPVIQNTDPPAADSGELLDAYTLRYGGQLYRYNEGIINILLIGADSDAPDIAGGGYVSAVQADVLVLCALDTKNDRLTLVSISRDTLCELETFDEDGNATGYVTAQLALSFAYGDGGQESLRLCSQAVSGLFGGLQIHGCGALYLDGLPVVNDAVGGVTVTVLDDGHYAYDSMGQGAEVTLTGDMAEAYLRRREATAEGNNQRMQKQKQYILALLAQAKAAVRNEPAKLLDIYGAASDYIVTDLSLSEISYLSTQALGMDFSQDLLNVPGESVQNGSYAEYRVDGDALTQLILDVFYEKVEG